MNPETQTPNFLFAISETREREHRLPGDASGGEGGGGGRKSARRTFRPIRAISGGMGAPAANGNDNDALFDASPLERHRRVSSILDPHAASGARGARSLAVQRAVETFVLCAQAATPLLQVEHAEERAWFRSKANTGKDMPTTTADLTDGERVLCDGCEAGIFDLYFTCAKCESDFCPFCAAEARIDDAKDANDKGKGVDELPMTTAAAPRAMATARDIARSGVAARRLANAGGAAALGLGIPTALLGIFRGEQWPGETQNGSAASGALPMPASSPPCPCCARDAKKTARRQLLSIQQRTAGTQRRQLYRLLGLPWPAPLPLATAPGPASCEISLPRLRRLHNPPGGTILPGLLVVPGGVNDADADDNNKETMGSLCVPTVRSRGVGEPNGILVVKLVPPRGSSLQSSRRSSGGGGAGIHSIHTGFHTRERTSTDRPTTAVTHLHALRNCLADGSPVLVCGCLGASTAQWDPGFFQAYHRRLYKSSKVDVDDCDDGAVVTIATDDFWKGYTTGDTYFSKPSCYNLKNGLWIARLPRCCQSSTRTWCSVCCHFYRTQAHRAPSSRLVEARMHFRRHGCQAHATYSRQEELQRAGARSCGARMAGPMWDLNFTSPWAEARRLRSFRWASERLWRNSLSLKRTSAPL